MAEIKTPEKIENEKTRIAQSDNSKKNNKEDKSLLIFMPKDPPTDYATNMSKFDKVKDNFHVMKHLEPHNIRREQILKAHPEVEKLLEKDTLSLYWAIVLNIAQLGMLFIIKNYVESWAVVLLLTYFISAVINHALFVLMHDITHFTCFKSVFLNQICAILANLPQALPNAISFGRYHRDHHTYLGDALRDPDIPTLWEVRFFSNKALKLVFLILMPIFYGLRPYVKQPKMQSPMEIVNIIVCFAYDYLVYQYCGMQGVVYLFIGTMWGLSINPVGIHILSEHYEFNKNQDTYSYYGWVNYLNFNMGYHLEHHDFPNIPWNKLPQLTEMAPEFYKNLPVIDSYLHVMYSYVFDDEIGPWSRVVREPEIKE